MGSFILWYLLVSLLGWLTFPLVFTLFPALSDRGYSLARTAGLLIWGFVFWLLAIFGIAQNDLGGLFLSVLVIVGLCVWIGKNHLKEMQNWLKQHTLMVVITEILFLLAFAFLAIIRAANPEILGTEKPMELAFINSIMRSPSFPPNDPWLSGYGISYYYFGYVIAAMLAKFTGVGGGVAFNLMLALVFALASIGAYGIIYNLLSVMRDSKDQIPTKASAGLPLLGPFFLLVVSNLEGFLELLHRKGFFWTFSTGGTASSNFWKWLDIKDLSQAPTLPLGWLPDRYLWWWRASRVVQDTTLQNAPQELIDEFPVFSYILGDLHPHVLAIPFDLLAISVGLNLFLGGWHGETKLAGMKFPVKWPGLFIPALVLGGLAFLNTWDILFGAAIVCGAFLLWRVNGEGWAWKRIEETMIFAVIVGLGSILLYLPFFTNFSSQAGGILPNLVNPARGAQLWVMFGSLFVPIFSFQAYMVFSQNYRKKWKASILTILGMVVVLWGLGWLSGWILFITSPDLVNGFLVDQGVPDLQSLFHLANLRRLSYIGSLITLILFMIPAFALLLGDLAKKRDQSIVVDQIIFPWVEEPKTNNPLPYIFMLLLLGGSLVLAPEFVYLRDQFLWRINTIFKFYYQAWILWSLMAAFGTAFLLLKLRRIWGWLFQIGMILTLAMALIYTVLGYLDRTNNFKPVNGWTLDGTAYMERDNPDEAMAINWLKQAPYGVVVEAVGGSYSTYARISTLSGLPTVLGWPGHESQWRGGYELQGNRQEDIKLLYETNSWEMAVEIIKRYNIRYIYIGMLERSTYRVNESKFQRVLNPIYALGSVVIYPSP
jgi:YYY domain-containing protein